MPDQPFSRTSHGFRLRLGDSESKSWGDPCRQRLERLSSTCSTKSIAQNDHIACSQLRTMESPGSVELDGPRMVDLRRRTSRRCQVHGDDLTAETRLVLARSG